MINGHLDLKNKYNLQTGCGCLPAPVVYLSYVYNLPEILPQATNDTNDTQTSG